MFQRSNAPAAGAAATGEPVGEPPPWCEWEAWADCREKLCLDGVHAEPDSAAETQHL